MFGPKLKDIKNLIDEALGSGEESVRKCKDLREEISRLREEKASLKFEKGLEEKEIAHLVKMKEEKLLIATEKKEIELKKEFQQKEMQLQKDYFDKVMRATKDGQDKMEDIYSKILERLPNVNVELSGKR